MARSLLRRRSAAGWSMRVWRRCTSSRAGAWENGYAESFHSRLRDELLAREEFADLAEARALGTAWRLDYNHRRPRSSLGYRTCGGVFGP